MTCPVKGYAAHSPTGRLGLFAFDRRSPRADELIRIQDVNVADERLLKADVKYRFVVDMASLKEEVQA